MSNLARRKDTCNSENLVLGPTNVKKCFREGHPFPALCKHVNPPLPFPLFAWFGEIWKGSGQGCLLLDVHRAQQCSDLEQGSINLGDYHRKCHSDEKAYRNGKKRKGPIWEEKNPNNYSAACLQVIPKIAASRRSWYIC